MLACLKMGRLEPPFDKHPKDGRLDMLPPHALLAIKTSSEARKLERAAGTRSDWVTDPGIQGSNLPPDGGGSPGLGFKSSSYTAVRGGAPIPGPRDPGRNAKNLEEMLQRTAVYDDDVVSGGDATCTRGPASRVKDVLDIKGDMRDWLGKGAKGEVAVRELAAQKERTKAVEMKLDATEMKLKLAADELQRLRDGMVRQQKRHAEEMADLQRAHQKEMSVFAKLVEVSSQVALFLFPHGQLDTDVVFCVQAKWDEREDETLTAIGVEVDAIRRSKDVIKSSTGGASAVPTIQVAGECHAVTLPYPNAQLPPNH